MPDRPAVSPARDRGAWAPTGSARPLGAQLLFLPRHPTAAAMLAVFVLQEVRTVVRPKRLASPKRHPVVGSDIPPVALSLATDEVVKTA